jgi:tetratricopeptide (TPR) repeat protein
MKWLRGFLALLIIAVSAAAAWCLVLPRYGCNRDKAIVNSWTIRLSRGSDEYARTVKARELAELCRRCLDRFPNDYEFHLLLGSNEGFLGDPDQAEQSFRRSIALNARPEAYAYLGVLLLEQGRTEEAKKTLYQGALFNLTVPRLRESARPLAAPAARSEPRRANLLNRSRRRSRQRLRAVMR